MYNLTIFAYWLSVDERFVDKGMVVDCMMVKMTFRLGFNEATFKELGVERRVVSL